MNKEEFEFPEIEVIIFGATDIITDSGGNDLGGETGGDEWEE